MINGKNALVTVTVDLGCTYTLSQSIRPLVARSDPIQGSPDQLPLLGLLDPTWVIQPPSDMIQTPFAQRTYCTRRRLLNGFSQLIELTNS